MISADQSNNWTTSGIWSCKNLLLILHAFHIYSWRLNTKQKEKGNYIFHNYIWWQKELILFQIYPIYTERSLEYFHSSGMISTIISAAADDGPDEMTCFPAGLHYVLIFTTMSKITQKSVCLYAAFSEKGWLDLGWYIAIFANFSIWEDCSEMSGILFRDTKVSWGVCTRSVRLEEGLTKIEVIKHTLIPVHSKSLWKARQQLSCKQDFR